MAFLGGILAFSLVVPSVATAQLTQLHEARASAFILVAEDGTVLARLHPSNNRHGELELYDPAGTRRAALVGSGALNIFDEGGSRLAFRAGRNFATSPAGLPPVNGVELGPGGSISMLLSSQ